MLESYFGKQGFKHLENGHRCELIQAMTAWRRDSNSQRPCAVLNGKGVGGTRKEIIIPNSFVTHATAATRDNLCLKPSFRASSTLPPSMISSFCLSGLHTPRTTTYMDTMRFRVSITPSPRGLMLLHQRKSVHNMLYFIQMLRQDKNQNVSDTYSDRD